MTKKELLAAIEDYPDDATILMSNWKADKCLFLGDAYPGYHDPEMNAFYFGRDSMKDYNESKHEKVIVLNFDHFPERYECDWGIPYLIVETSEEMELVQKLKKDFMVQKVDMKLFIKQCCENGIVVRFMTVQGKPRAMIEEGDLWEALFEEEKNEKDV